MQRGTHGMTWHTKGCPGSRGKYRVHKPVPGAGTSTVMAELVRQVTSGCAERGRALAATWNLHVGLTDALTGALAMDSVPLPGPYTLSLGDERRSSARLVCRRRSKIINHNSL